VDVKNVLIIGGSYFAGRVFVEQLAALQACQVFVMNRGNVPLQMPGVREIRCDRHQRDAMEESLPSVTWHAVVDFCGYTGFDIASLLSVLPAHALGHYIFISTASVYARTHSLPVTEGSETLPSRIQDPDPGMQYALKKRLAELKLETLCRDLQIPYTILRPAFIYGRYNYAPRESYFFDLIESSRPIVLPQNGLSLFSCVAVDDVARACIACMANAQAYDQAFNLAGPELISYRRLTEVFEAITGRRLKTITMSTRDIDAQGLPLPYPLEEHLIYSGARITQALGLEYTPFLEGMRDAYAWYRRKINEGRTGR
jgi:2'-hydroxyisoflavone reductase